VDFSYKTAHSLSVSFVFPRLSPSQNAVEMRISDQATATTFWKFLWNRV